MMDFDIYIEKFMRLYDNNNKFYITQIVLRNETT